jgi:ubiquinone/menaquinone biosynthesis C-methylase UbiE
MAGNVEYVGLVAEAWDALRGDTSEWPDRAFYLDVIRERGEPVLDVGCGTGRLLLDYLRVGIDIDGVDNSADMLAICRRKADRAGLRPNLFLQPMEDLDLPRRYATIIVPSSSFQLVIDPADAVAALAGLRRHLEPDGVLAMPFIAMDAPHEEHWVREAELEDGSIVRRTASAIYDPATRLESTDDLYEQLRDGVVVRSVATAAIRWPSCWTRRASTSWSGAPTSHASRHSRATRSSRSLPRSPKTDPNRSRAERGLPAGQLVAMDSLVSRSNCQRSSPDSRLRMWLISPAW